MSHRNGDEWGWPDVEELLQCPICLDVPSGNSMVEQCRNGHHICAICKPQVSECPICKSIFYGTRNFVVEELVNHYEVLKNLLLLTSLENPESQKKSKPKKKPKVAKVAVIPKRKLDTPKSSRGDYPCRAVGCDKMLPSCRIVNHVRSAHSDAFTEGVIGDNGVFSKDFEIVYPIRDYYQKSVHIFSIRGIGLVFIEIEVLQSGELLAYLRMAAPLMQANKFIACLEFSNPLNNASFDYRQKLVSVRESVLGMFQKKLVFILSKTSCERICTSRKINCTVIVKLYSELRDRSSLSNVDPFTLNIVAALRASLIEVKLKQKTNKTSKSSTTNSNNGAIKKTFSNNQSASTVGVCPLDLALPPQQSTTTTGASGTQNKSKKQKRRKR